MSSEVAIRMELKNISDVSHSNDAAAGSFTTTTYTQTEEKP